MDSPVSLEHPALWAVPVFLGYPALWALPGLYGVEMASGAKDRRFGIVGASFISSRDGEHGTRARLVALLAAGKVCRF